MNTHEYLRGVAIILPLIFCNVLFAQGQIQAIDIPIPADISAQIPGLTNNFYLVDAAEDGGDIGYLVLLINKAAFTAAIDQRSKDYIEGLLNQYNAYNSSCRWGTRKITNFSSTHVIQFAKDPQYSTISFSYNYRLLAVPSYLEWQWRGFHSGLHWVDQGQQIMVGLDATTDFSFAVNQQAAGKSLSYRNAINGAASLPFKECWCFVNPIYNKCTPGRKDISKVDDKPVNIPADQNVFKTYLNMTDIVGINSDDQYIYVYFSLKVNQ